MKKYPLGDLHLLREIPPDAKVTHNASTAIYTGKESFPRGYPQPYAHSRGVIFAISWACTYGYAIERYARLRVNVSG